jgi:hypothetical protein
MNLEQQERRHKCCRCLKMGVESEMNRYPFNKKWFHDPKCPTV